MVSTDNNPVKWSELNLADCELLAFAKVGREYRGRESSLYTQKWFDYRELHPIAATLRFAECYRDALVNIYAETKDARHSADVDPFPTGALNSREFLGLWCARQACDSIGVRYEFALRFAMKRFTHRGWRMFPRPNQLYGEELVLDTRDAWNLECAASLQIAKSARFRIEAFKGHPDQIAYQEWLVTQVKLRPNAEYPLSRLLGERLLTPEFVGSRFGEKALNKAKTMIV